MCEGEGEGMTRNIRVQDLPDQTGLPYNHPAHNVMLVCQINPDEHQWSANRNDYWSDDPYKILKCCQRNMLLVSKRTEYVEYRPDMTVDRK